MHTLDGSDSTLPSKQMTCSATVWVLPVVERRRPPLSVAGWGEIASQGKCQEVKRQRGTNSTMENKMRVTVLSVIVFFSVVCCNAAFADSISFFTQTNDSSVLPCSSSTPCGTWDVALGTGSFTGQLFITVQLSGPADHFQFDRLGFNSADPNLFLDCFNFGATCTSGLGGASLGGSMQEDGFGKFDYTLNTGLNGGSGCAPDGTGSQNLFSFVISDPMGHCSRLTSIPLSQAMWQTAGAAGSSPRDLEEAQRLSRRH